MEEKKLTYWQFLKTNQYPWVLLSLIGMLIVGITHFNGELGWGELLWVVIFSIAIIVILIGGFWLHWKEYLKR